MNDQAKPKVNPKLLENPVFQRVLSDALAIQDRFAAEPVYAKTGKGYLKSAGVEELQQIKTRYCPAKPRSGTFLHRPQSCGPYRCRGGDG